MTKIIDKEKEKQALRNKGLTDPKVIEDLIIFKEHHPHLQKKRLLCEMYDKVNLMCRKYMDRMARFEVDYDFEVNEEAFKNVMVCCFEAAPFLHSQVINSPITPYWRVCDYNIEQAVIVKRVDDIEKARTEFFSKGIPLDSNVQINIGLFYCDNKTYILFIWNHMCFDGGGYKSFWTDVCKNYSDYVLYGRSPVNFATGSRKYTEIYKDLDEAHKKKAKKQLANVSPKDKHRFPFANNNYTDNVIIGSTTVEPEYFNKAIAYAKSKGATVNDLILAAYIDALGKIAGYGENESISISAATDLRRHIKDPSAIGYTNHVSFVHCSINRKGKDIKETLEIVSRKMKEVKSDPYMGLHGLPLLNFAYKSMTYLQAETLVKLFYKNPVLSVSNVGSIDTIAFSLEQKPPFSAFVAGAAKNKPCAVMTALSINGTFKASICLRGTEEDKKLLDKFFAEFKKSIESI